LESSKIIPTVSIFVCFYNQEQYVNQTLNSFIDQVCDFKFEIVIADDYSKDGTLQKCIEYQNMHPQIITILHREKNLGLVENFFEGLTHCKGKYIATCGGDDYWTDHNKLQTQVDFLEDNPDYVITYHDSIMTDENEQVIAESEVGIINQRDFSSAELQKGAFISARTICFRNILDFNKIDYKHVLNEDFFLFALLGEYGKGKYLGNIKPAVYRILKQGIWSSLNEIQRQIAKISTLKSLEIYFNNNPLKYYYKNRRVETIYRIFYLAQKERNHKLFFQYAFKCFFIFHKTYNSVTKFQLLKTIIKYSLKTK
jgi:glycosyltransferase involved in cell wall biosynthesis